VTGDWITPHADGVRYLEKPPLLYWLTALCYRLGGVSEVYGERVGGGGWGRRPHSAWKR
jgi:hypothetical protein